MRACTMQSADRRRQDVGIDFCRWSYATFSSREDFDAYHRSIGESCDYASMKTEMLSSVSSSTDSSWFNIDLSWRELPDIDWSLPDVLDL